MPLFAYCPWAPHFISKDRSSAIWSITGEGAAFDHAGKGCGGWANFLDTSRESGPFEPWLSAPWSVPPGVVSSPSRPSWCRSLGKSHLLLRTCPRQVLLHSSPPHLQFFLKASRPQGTFSSQMDCGLSPWVSSEILAAVSHLQTSPRRRAQSPGTPPATGPHALKRQGWLLTRKLLWVFAVSPGKPSVLEGWVQRVTPGFWV